MASDRIFLDAGVLIGAILLNDSRNPEATLLVESARRGDFSACTSVGILSEVYAALTWSKSLSPSTPTDAALAVTRLIELPSAIQILGDGLEVALLSLRLASAHTLTARRIHDARHAATALVHDVPRVYTYDPGDWQDFVSDGLAIVGPTSTMARLTPTSPGK